MSIWKELYDIFDRERTTWRAESASKQSLVFELKGNLVFLADGLKNGLNDRALLTGLERKVFDQCLSKGVSLKSICHRKVSSKTIGEFDEFKKYLGKDTGFMITKAYVKMGSLAKLLKSSPQKNHSLRFKSLFRFLMLVVAHLEGRPLKRRAKA